MDRLSKCIFDEDIAYFVSTWVSLWISVMVITICYSLRGSASGSMTYLMVEHGVGKYMSCSFAYSRRHLPFVLSLPFPYLPMLSGY